MLNATKLLQVIEIDRSGSVTSAAAKLNISQSAVSRNLADIELGVGFAIFDRTNRGLSATEQGRRFIDRAERIIVDLQILTEEMKTSAKVKNGLLGGLLRIGVMPPAVEELLNDAMTELAVKFPSITIQLHPFEQAQGVKQLRRGNLDALIAPTRQLRGEVEVAYEEIGALKASYFCRKGHPLTKLARLTPNDLKGFRIISPELHGLYANALLGLLDGAKLDPVHPVHIVNCFRVVAQMVEHTDCLSIVSEGASESPEFKKRFARLPLEFSNPMSLCCAYRNKWAPERRIQAFLSVLRSNPPAGGPRRAIR